MKLLFIQETDWLRRNPAQQHHLAEMLSLRGHEIRVIDYELLWRTQVKKELYSRRQVFHNVSKIHDGARVTVFRPGIIKIPVLEYISLVFSHRRELERQMNEFKPDAIVAWGILNTYLAIKAAHRSNIPLLYYWIDVLDRLISFKAFRIVGRLVESRTLRQSDRILVINDRLREYVIRLGAPPGLTQVLRAGIDTKQFNPDSNHRAIRNQYGLDEQDIVLFFMGWLYRFSGLKEVILQLAVSKNRNLKLLIVGEGDSYEELQQIRSKFYLQDRVILAGKKPYQEIPGLIATADFCLLPAYPSEPIMQDIVPIKMYEYMAMRKPVIATRLPGVVREFGGDNGVVYVDGPQDVVTKVDELIRNGSGETLGARARSFAERNSWDNITDEFEKILEETIKEKQDEQLFK